MTQPIRFAAPITKFKELPDGRLLVEGIATSEAIDSQDERLAFGGSVQAMSKWLETGPAIREAHDPKKPVGRGLEMFPDERSKAITVRAFVSKGAPDTQAKVKDGTLAMFSVGGEPKTWSMEKIGKKKVRNITEWEMHELSLVDRGANPDCYIDLVKADTVTDIVGEGELMKAETKPAPADESEEQKPAEEAPPAEEKPAEGAEEKPEAPVETKAYSSIEEAKKGLQADVEACQKEEAAAIDAAQKARSAIAATAEAFGLADMLPKEWGAKKAKKAKDAEKARAKADVPSMTKDDMACWDIRTALDTLAGLESLRASEQMEQAAGLPEPPEQVGLLDTAIGALKAFVASEAQELVPAAVAPVEAAAEPKWVKALADATAPLTKMETRLTEVATKISAIEKAAGDLKALPGEVKALRDEVEKIKSMPLPGGPRARFVPDMAKSAVTGSATDRVKLVEEMLATAGADAEPYLRVELARAKAAAAAAGA